VPLNPFRKDHAIYNNANLAQKYDFRKDIKLLLNAAIEESRSKFNEFEDLMKEVFTLGEV
jgi:hypothetical protein